jgi:hypothetical protein
MYEEIRLYLSRDPSFLSTADKNSTWIALCALLQNAWPKSGSNDSMASSMKLINDLSTAAKVDPLAIQYPQRQSAPFLASCAVRTGRSVKPHCDPAKILGHAQARSLISFPGAPSHIAVSVNTVPGIWLVVQGAWHLRGKSRSWAAIAPRDFHSQGNFLTTRAKRR